ncbi:bifunctional UDP-N-acetylmuramoyl-tripeptide:D-alanyl-D-alanine ligase/alanine racemase [Plebeiibacterium sediminum]|uniref:Alanine racemase n=1 Tax=Plebeiibacterium sediminum TaxID=2992112 RepID=A0AAE3SFM5_9BACT|nr:bifunctional UDP-N-acetylmuramoyl-tripeptide:D-alanyl-D-alanine ligase/alanine racemase [Plebeiobacterium sediminum]MCW3786348.1 bifunctional UDP-N-acetylmuramoyl-tripeptide:D-alanyl-D-alanine ligase/alanine racemase [Plebeiobacterium sediminum]
MMQSYLFSRISEWAMAKTIINNDLEISYIITDSRSVSYPEKSLFIAITGGNHNGHDYISSLYQQGVRCFMVDEHYAIDEKLADANYIIADNTLECFQRLVAEKRHLYHCPVIGVTGSNGKTIVKEWISQLIGNSKVLVRSPKSYNSQIGVPLSVWQLNKNTEVAVFEAGISQMGEMERIASVIEPTIGLITNIGAAHQENFASRKEKLNEKLKLFANSEIIVFSTEVPFVEEGISKMYPHKNVLRWGTNLNNELQIVKKVVASSSSQVELKWNNKTCSLELPFIDEVSFENAMHAIAVLLYLGYDLKYMESAVKKLVPVAMRMELKEGVNNCILVNDSYNSDISSLGLSLDFLIQQSRKSNTVRTLILSDIYQSGIESEVLCRQINDLLKKKGISRLIGVGEVLKNNAQLFDLEASFYNTTAELLDSISHNTFKNEAILIKGSRNFEFEQVSDFLEKKHHQTRLEINLNALVDNLNYFRSKLKDTTKILAMVKAFSYGSGSFEIANVLQHQKVDYLGVAFADEGIELRKSGVSLPIIVMNPEVKSFPAMIEHQLEPEIYSFKVLNQFIDVLRNEGLTQYPVHIKVDTGMNRLGFMTSEIDQLKEVLRDLNEIRVRSVFSHLVGSDEVQFDDFTKTQINTFDRVTQELKEALGYSFIRHILNTAGILRFTESQFDMVRVGIGMYGIGVEGHKKLKNVTSFKSYISQIREVKAHETIGYGRRGELAYDSDIAVVPVGYADGLNRKLGNGVGKMMVNNQLAPIIGNICMDMCMIDVTGLNAKEGDEVQIFGPAQPVSDLAKALGTIPYEIFTSISRRVKRIYYYE